MRINRATAALWLLGAALLASMGRVPAAVAQSAYPNRPIRLVIPFPAGGSNDIVGRVVAHELGGKLGQPIVIDNKTGAGGVIGAEVVAKAPADGYTILLISSSFTMVPALQKLSYDPASAFQPITMLGSAPSVLAINPKLPPSSLAELLALAKTKPREVRLAAAGAGSYQHLISEQLQQLTGTEFLIVQYRGGAPVLNDLVAGHADFTVGTVPNMLGFIRAGQVKALAIAGARRVKALPEVPTTAEAGLPDYVASNWWALLAPAGTQREIVQLLHKTTAEVLESEGVRQRFEAEGAEVFRMGPEELVAYLQSETAKWADVVRKGGIKLE